MSTLIIKHRADGKKKGQCDSRCYNAKTPVCICCCGGANHGIGLQKALEATKEIAEQINAEQLELQGLTISDLKKIGKEVIK